MKTRMALNRKHPSDFCSLFACLKPLLMASFIFLLFLSCLGYEGGNILVAFYNGQTVQLSPGVAVRIPLAVFDRIVTELQLPESQRRKIRLAADTSTPPYQGRPPPVHTTWQRPFSPPRHQKQTWSEHDSKDALSEKIKSQLERNRHLLERVKFEEEGKDDGNLSDADAEEANVEDDDREDTLKYAETFDVCVGTEDIGENSFVMFTERHRCRGLYQSQQLKLVLLKEVNILILKIENSEERFIAQIERSVIECCREKS